MENLEASKKLYESEITALHNSKRDTETEMSEYKASHSVISDAQRWHYAFFGSALQPLCKEQARHTDCRVYISRLESRWWADTILEHDANVLQLWP